MDGLLNLSDVDEAEVQAERRAIARAAEAAVQPPPPPKGWFARMWHSMSCRSGVDGAEVDAYGVTPAQREKFLAALPQLRARWQVLQTHRDWKAAGEVSVLTARCCALVGKRKDASQHYAEAGACALNEAVAIVEKADIPRSSFSYVLSKLKQGQEERDVQGDIDRLLADSVAWRVKAIEEASIGGWYTEQAAFHKDLADFLRHQSLATYDPDAALMHLENAARLYGNAHKRQAVQGCLVDIAEVHQAAHRFDSAADVWRQCVEVCVEDPLLKFSAIRYDLAEMLCRVAHHVACFLADGDGAAAERSHEALENHYADLQYLDALLTPLRTERILITALLAACVATPPDTGQVHAALTAYRSTSVFEPLHHEAVAALERLLPKAGRAHGGLLRFFR
eukprot:TRINITY_DN24814_c0_g1_i1.p1 TRINITY_DN24814_c0_g1~~TRINITY_DN24814_c0_g1_i1.p1  ORF type:complete len:409 (+),score=102.26 TRINITY_DN24814_c0_g1_i1:43-1227(+)